MRSHGVSDSGRGLTEYGDELAVLAGLLFDENAKPELVRDMRDYPTEHDRAQIEGIDDLAR